MTSTDRTYTIEEGFFSQDTQVCSEPVPPRLGLLDDKPDRWTTFVSRLTELNKNAPPGVSYKAIIAGRHGQGFHNLAEEICGTPVWEEDWGLRYGNSTMTWGPDARLTDKGKDQARNAHRVWVEETGTGLTLPGKFYCSPLTRAITTCIITFDGLPGFEDVHPLILENCREQYGRHTCDMRRKRTEIAEEFPKFRIEDSLTENDELFEKLIREEESHVQFRAHTVMNRIFENDSEQVISITAHSGFITGLLKAVNHIPHPLNTGGVIAMVVKGEVITKQEEDGKVES